MKFIDIAKINITAGKGGDGHVSFRKEKFVPKGGPDGGNGGKGGNVILKVNPHMNTLLDFRYQRNYQAEDGQPGGKSKMTGKDGKDLIIQVPTGTAIFDQETEELICDLDGDNSEYLIAKGGNGGFGNSEFATATNQAPRYAKPGLEGEAISIKLELKLLADVGLVGFPNAGKSTLISVMSAAKPKIADYPFTTLVPNLGIVRVSDTETFVMADIPGIIEGAAEGKGLGHQFLRHIERTKVLLFLIDITSEDIEEQYKTLENELEKYSEETKGKERIIALTKTDAVGDDTLKEFQNMMLNGIQVMLISSVAGKNIDKLKLKISEKLKKI